MIRPASLIRSDSYEGRTFSAPANNMKSDAIDCGITNLPWCGQRFQRCATSRCYITVLAFLALSLGAVEGYFRSTVKHVAHIFKYPPEVIEWLLVAHGIFIICLAFAVSYWGNRIHRVAWLGGLACIQGATCFLLIIPFLSHTLSNVNGKTSTIHEPVDDLCKKPPEMWGEVSEMFFHEDEPCWITLIVLFVLQLMIAFGNITYYTHGLTYLDDNVDEQRSPIYLAVAIGVRIASHQTGSFMAWLFLQISWSLWWVGFPILGFSLIILGGLTASFPMHLLSTVLKKTAASILDIATGNSSESLDDTKDDAPERNFWPTLKRLLTNKLLMMNILASVFMGAALVNFDRFEARYLEAQFYMPMSQENFQDPWISRLMKNMLKSPFVLVSICLAGLVIASVKPRANRLALWNVGTSLFTVCLFASYIFFDCKTSPIAGDYRGSLVTPFCSRNCDCSRPSVEFSPVCVLNDPQTYFSPCHGGCTDVFKLNDMVMYGNCSCSSNPNVASTTMYTMTEGACENSSCTLHYMLFQTFSVLAAAIIASGLVGNLMITLRSVRPMDKAGALGLEMFAAATITYLPANFAYKSISDRTCLYWNSDSYTCNLHNSYFSDYISVLTASLLFISIIFDYFVFKWSEDLELYGEDTLSTYFAASPPENVSISPHVHYSARTASPEEQPLNLVSRNRPESAQQTSPIPRIYRTTQI